MQQKWWETPAAAWGFLIFGLGGGGVLTYLSSHIGMPVCGALILAGIILLVRAYRKKRLIETNQEKRGLGVIGGNIQPLINKKTKGKIEQQTSGFSIKVESITTRSMHAINKGVDTKYFLQYLTLKISFRTTKAIQIASLRIGIDSTDPNDTIEPDISLVQGFKVPYILPRGESHEFQFLLPFRPTNKDHNLVLEVLAGGHWYADGPYKVNC